MAPLYKHFTDRPLVKDKIMDRKTYDAALAVAIELYEKVKEAVAIVEQAKESPNEGAR